MILVVGATGNLGGVVTRMLLAQGKPVRILARPHSNYQPLAEAGARVAMGDLKDRGSLDTVCQGVDVVITTANSAGRGGEDNPQSVDLEGNRHLIDAAKAARVNHFIFVSALNADPDSPVPVVQAKGKTEEYLRESGMPYTIMAPNAYMEVMVNLIVGMPAMMGQPVMIMGEGRRKHSFISAVDVAAFIVAAIDNPAAINRKLILGGPEPLSFRNAVAIYERVLERKIPIKTLVPGEPFPGLPESVAPILASLDLCDSPIAMTQTASTFGIRLTPLEEVARRTAEERMSSEKR